MDEILEKMKDMLYEIMPDISIKREDITLSTRIKEDVELTSIGVFYLVVAIENEFGVEMRNQNMADFVTIGDVVTFINEN